MLQLSPDVEELLARIETAMDVATQDDATHESRRAVYDLLDRLVAERLEEIPDLDTTLAELERLTRRIGSLLNLVGARISIDIKDSRTFALRNMAAYTTISIGFAQAEDGFRAWRAAINREAQP